MHCPFVSPILSSNLRLRGGGRALSWRAGNVAPNPIAYKPRRRGEIHAHIKQG